MTADRDARPSSSPARPGMASELKRIPLPPLPHFRPPAPGRQEAASPGATPDAGPGPERPLTQAAPVSHVEMSELLAPGHEGGISPAIDAAAPQRTGATGATILNDLVDEIEKGLEREIARSPLEITPQGYRRVVSCSTGTPTSSAAIPVPGTATPPVQPRRSDA